MTDDPRCARCGHPRSNHPYRHPFVGLSWGNTITAQAPRIEDLEAKLKWVLQERDTTFALMLKRAETAEAKLAKAVEVLRELIDHTHNCEKELTEELHNADFCGESLPLTSARITLVELKGQDDE